MEKYCVFLFDAKQNKFGDVLLKDVTKEDAVAEKDNLRKGGLPAHYEKEEIMKKKYKLVL